MNHLPKCRERVIPNGYRLMISDDELGVAAYIGREGTAVIAYSGRRIKPDFNHSFKCVEYGTTFEAAWQAKLKPNRNSSSSAAKSSAMPKILLLMAMY